MHRRPRQDPTSVNVPEKWLRSGAHRRLSPKAFRLHVYALLFCVLNNTDGVLEDGADLCDVPGGADTDSVLELEAAELWQRHGEEGWLLVEFSDTQLTSSKLEVLENIRRRESHHRHRRRAQKAGAQVEVVDYEKILVTYGMTCWICRHPIADRGDLHMDHMIPLARGGKHAYGNIRPAHAACNMHKGARILCQLCRRDMSDAHFAVDRRWHLVCLEWTRERIRARREGSPAA